MRLGLRPTVFEPDAETWSICRKLYGGSSVVWERHRHRYEVNPEFVDRLQTSGLSFVGKDEKGERMQILEFRGACNFRSPLTKFAPSSGSLQPHNDRPPVLCRVAGPPGVLHSASEPVSAVPRLRGGFMWGLGSRRATGSAAFHLQAPASSSRYAQRSCPAVKLCGLGTCDGEWRSRQLRYNTSLLSSCLY